MFNLSIKARGYKCMRCGIPGVGGHDPTLFGLDTKLAQNKHFCRPCCESYWIRANKHEKAFFDEFLSECKFLDNKPEMYNSDLEE